MPNETQKLKLNFDLSCPTSPLNLTFLCFSGVNIVEVVFQSSVLVFNLIDLQ